MTPRRTAEVEVDGFGPVTIRALSRGRVKRIRSIEDRADLVAETVRRGMVEPRLTPEVAHRLAGEPNAPWNLCAEILEFSRAAG